MNLLYDGDFSQAYTEIAPYYDELMSGVPYDMWVDYVELLLLKVEYPPTTVLDVACGTGNVSFELARRDYVVTGVDASLPMIEVARGRPQPKGAPPVMFVHQDACTLSLPYAYDLAVCLYDSLNYITSPSDLGKALRRIRQCVKPGGYFIFDVNSEYALAENLFTQNNLHREEDLHYLWKSSYDRETRISRVEMFFEYRRNGEAPLKFKEVHYERAYSIEELKKLLAAAGWKVKHLYDGYSDRRPDPTSERLFFVVQNV